MKRKLFIIAGVLVVIGATAAGALYYAYPAQVSIYVGLTRNYFLAWFAPSGTTTTELNAPYKDAGTRAAESAANVDAARLVQADQDPGNWMTYGRTYSEQRFSPLTQITADNVNLLGLAWYADFDIDRGQEATPLVIDGVMYVSTAWSMVRRSPPAVSYSLSSVASATAMQRWAAG